MKMIVLFFWCLVSQLGAFEPAVVAGCVDAIRGTYFEKQVDLSLAGAEELTLERNYLGKQGWQFNHDRPAHLKKKQHKRPNGNVVTYSYDSAGKLSKVATPFNSLDFHQREKVIGSDGRCVLYHYTQNEGKKRPLLTRVELPGQTIRYEYVKDFLTKKVLPDHRFLGIDYYFNQGRVKELRAPVGEDQTPIVTHRFLYHPGYTEVYDAFNHKTVYRFSAKERLKAIERFDDYGLFSKELFVWNEHHLTAHHIQNKAQENVKIIKTVCDSQGNILEEQLIGQLTGEDLAPQTLSTRYTYSNDGLNLPLSCTDLRKTEEYSYHPGTNLKTSILTKVAGKIVKREFRCYNADGVVLQKVIDDGSRAEMNDLTDVSERHFTLIFPRIEKPVGLPERIEEWVLDNSLDKKRLLKKVVNTHSPEGWLRKQEVYDSNNHLSYTLSWQHDVRGNVIQAVDREGQSSYKLYDSHDNLVWEQRPDGTIKKYRYDFSNRLIQEDEIGEEGQIATVAHRYNHLSQKIATLEADGRTTHYKYDLAGNLIQKNETTYAYDVLGHKLSETNERGHTTLFYPTLHGKSYKIEYPDGTQESFLYDLDGALLRSIDRKGSYTLYENDYLGRPIKQTTFSAKGQFLDEIETNYSLSTDLTFQ